MSRELLKRNDSQAPVVVFDFDGTLADSMPGIAAALEQALPSLGLPPPDPDGIPDNIGHGLRHLCRWAAGDPDEASLERTTRAVRAAYRETWRGHTSLFPGILEMLETLRSRGAVLAVLSNKAHDFTVEMTRSLIPDGMFHSIIGISEVTRPKPDPEGLLGIVRSVSPPRAEAFLVGDMSVDVRTGAAAGLPVIGVSWGFQGARAFTRRPPWRLALNPPDILRFTGRPSTLI